MTENKKLNPAAIIPLKNALATIYWYKKDLRSFLSSIFPNSPVLNNIDWTDYKINISNNVINRLISDEDKYQTELIDLFLAITSIKDFSHLRYLDNGSEKVDKAQKAVDALKAYTSGYQQLWEDKQQISHKRNEYLEKLKNTNSFNSKLEEIKKEYCQLAISDNMQGRGYKLETIMYDLFNLFDLDPKASFRKVGEQIDGAFTFDNIDFLFEAKWINEVIGCDDLDSLSLKVQRKLDNTLGLFLAMNGFSDDGIKAHEAGKKVLILMEGSDLMAVFDGRIDFLDMLRRKRRHASEKGNILLRFSDM
jgi:hypothetical protein